MSNQSEIEEFDRNKIYEKLEYQSKPLNYSGKLPWIVQRQIAATNGMQYADIIGKLTDYPVYQLPVPKVTNGIMLDIGNGWGRWLVAGANKGYIPVGIDIRLEFCETAISTLRAQGKNGYSLVADLKNIPFTSGVFDLVWSFSVIQHTHKERLLNCLEHINRILKADGFALLEFPNRTGIKNSFTNVKAAEHEKDNYNSWSVRYYTIKEYKEMFLKIFGNFSFKNHSFIGIGILPEDLRYVSFKNKILCSVSLLGSLFTKFIPPLKKISDSIYIKAFKNTHTAIDSPNQAAQLFTAAHNSNPTDNLNLIHILRCPVSAGNLILSNDRKQMISPKAGIAYPVINDIPILIPSEASSI